jgi:crossover junction endodeoxyribonuclease RuvC
MTQISIWIDPGLCGAMAAIIRRMSPLGVTVVTLEEAHGRGFGIWEGILGALDVPCRTVSPIVWTKKVLAGVSGGGKERPISFALRMFPGCELTPKGSRKPRDGRADALCLAYYGAVA